MSTKLGMGLLALLLVATPGAAQTVRPNPSSADRQAAAHNIDLHPGGVGGCVFISIKGDVRRAIVTEIEEGRRGLPAAMPQAVAGVAARCTGRPYSNSDLALVGAALSTFMRVGTAIYIASEFAIGQTGLDAAWTGATPAEKAPYLAAADAFLTPQSPATKTTPEQLGPFLARLKIDPNTDPRMLGSVQAYFLATALRERAEAQLTAQGVHPVSM